MNDFNASNLDNSGRRIVVDPVTRIEGHMRLSLTVGFWNMNLEIRSGITPHRSESSLVRLQIWHLLEQDQKRSRQP